MEITKLTAIRRLGMYYLTIIGSLLKVELGKLKAA